MAERRLGTLVASAAWALRRTWAVHRGLTATLVGAALVRSLVPAGVVLAARGLINAVSAGLGGGTGGLPALLPWLLLGVGCTALEALARAVHDFASRRLQGELTLSLTDEILARAARLEPAHFEDPRFQDVLEQARRDTAGSFGKFLEGALGACAESVRVASLTAVLVYIEPLVALALLLVGVPFLLAKWRFARMRYEEEQRRTTSRRWISYFVSLLVDARSVPEVRILGIGPHLVARFRAIAEGFRSRDARLHRLVLAGDSVFIAVSVTAFWAAFVWVAIGALRGTETIGDVAVFGGVTARMSFAIEQAVTAFTGALESTLFISNLLAFLRLEPRRATPAAAGRIPAPAALEATGLAFAYPGASREVLSELSLRIAPGEIVALAGGNGAGKTTLAKLLARLYEPARGTILLGGVDLTAASPVRAHPSVSVLFQEAARFEATLAENVAYGDWERLSREPELIEGVGRRAGLDALAAGMPQGYDTLLGRMFGDYTPSGGEWQRIALARTLARNAALLVLDEPTLHLDQQAERFFIENLRALCAGRTVVLITHHPPLLSAADRVLFLSGGRVAEEGRHGELLERGGAYASLFGRAPEAVHSPGGGGA
ncbi:MAG: ABC transporter ATP-binding protein [Thermoanaerobaculia bacterium]